MKKLIIACLAATALALLSACTTVKDSQPAPYRGDITPGTIGALAVLEKSGRFLLASDTVSLRSTLDTGIVPKNTWNADALVKSLDEIRRIEAQGATVLCGHDDAQWASLRKGPDAYG